MPAAPPLPALRHVSVLLVSAACLLVHPLRRTADMVLSLLGAGFAAHAAAHWGSAAWCAAAAPQAVECLLGDAPRGWVTTCFAACYLCRLDAALLPSCALAGALQLGSFLALWWLPVLLASVSGQALVV